MKTSTLLTLTLFGSLTYCNAFAEGQLPESFGQSCYPRLGLTLGRDLNILKMEPGSPSEKARLLCNDQIIAIEGHPVNRLTAKNRNLLLAGQSGTVVHLLIRRGSAIYAVALIRTDLCSSTSKDLPASKNLPQSEADIQPNHNNFSGVTLVRKTLNDWKANLIDSELVTVARQTERTKQLKELVLEALALLPPEVKKDLQAYGVSIVITPTLAELNNSHGGCCFDVRGKRVLIAEVNDVTNTPIPLTKRTIITILHEIGHAYDYAHDQISAGSGFQYQYEQESNKVPDSKRKILEYFLQEDVGPTHVPSSECFASLFACKYYDGYNERLDTLKTCFQKSFKLVEDLH